MVVLIPLETAVACSHRGSPGSYPVTSVLSLAERPRPLPPGGRVTSQAFLARTILRIRAAAKIHVWAILTTVQE